MPLPYFKLKCIHGGFKRTLVLFLFGLACSCANVEPSGPDELLLQAPSQWGSTERELIPVINPGWLRDFGDPELLMLVEEALRNNFNLKITAARLRVASAQAHIAGSQRVPEIGVSTSAQRGRSNISSGAGPVSDYSTRYSFGFDVSWEADVWGRIAATGSASETEALATRWDYSGARLSLVAQVAQTWFSFIEARMQAELAESSVSSFTRTLNMVRQRFERGLSRGVDVHLAANNLAIAQVQLAQRRSQIQSLARQIQVLLGRYPDAKLVVSSELPQLVESIPAGLPSELLVRRPDLKASETRFIAAGWRVNAAKSQLLPQFRLTSSIGTSSDEIHNLLDIDYLVWNLIGNVTGPLFNGGRLRENVNVSEALQDEQLAHYVQTVLIAFREVEDAISADRWLAAQELSLGNAIEEAQASERLAEQQYQLGIGGILTLLEAQRRRINAESQSALTRRERVNNRVRLHLALGGDFSSPLPPEH